MGASQKPSSSLFTPSFPFSSDTYRGRSMRYIVAASSMGTIIEWYDFYLFGSLAVFLAPVFFPSKTLGTSLILYLGTFAAGFAVRPFGALVFGRLGDKVGRKYAFLLTITIMGSATTIIGLLPSYQAIGLLAPAILLFIRMLQGLALGGEYGGAAIYVAEHAPDEKRGYWTSYIQTTATIGLFLSLIVILATSLGLGASAFNDWGWRIPLLLSSVLVAAALALGTPLFIFFGRLSDRIGRKKIIMAGCGLAAATYYPLYIAMTYFSDKASFNAPALTLLVLTQVIYVTMVYGPIAALLVEMFPGRTRYTSLSLPYHLGNGEFGGFTPVLVVAINVAAGSILAGLIYPIGVALVTLVIGSLYIKETKDVSIW